MLKDKLNGFLVALIIGFMVFAGISYSFDVTWDEDAPAGSDNPRSGDDEIRNTRYGLRERLAVDHYFLADESGSDIGNHKKVTLLNEDLKGAATPPAKANTFIFFGADSTPSGTAYTELFGIDEQSNVIKFTDNGVLNSGTVGGLTPSSTGIKPLGSWATKNDDTVYQAGSDGFVVVYSGSTDTNVTIYTDASNPPTTARSHIYGGGGTLVSATIPVKRNDYYKITLNSGTAPNIYWIPLGE